MSGKLVAWATLLKLPTHITRVLYAKLSLSNFSQNMLCTYKSKYKQLLKVPMFFVNLFAKYIFQSILSRKISKTENLGFFEERCIRKRNTLGVADKPGNIIPEKDIRNISCFLFRYGVKCLTTLHHKCTGISTKNANSLLRSADNLVLLIKMVSCICLILQIDF